MVKAASLRIDVSSHLKRLSQIQERQLYAIQAYGKAAGDKMVRYAKANRPWTDRTHMARNTINTSTSWHHGRLRVNLHSGVEYGIYLEKRVYRYKGRLAIWQPTVNKLAPEILRAWAERMKGV